MNTSIQIITLGNLALAMLPALAVVGILYKWSMDYRNALYGISRMLIQLLLIGYLLAYIFQARSQWIVLMVLMVMVGTASWISLRTVGRRTPALYAKALAAIVFGGGVTFLLITLGVLNLQPWYLPTYAVPLAGMIFANAMNSVSLAAERLESELGNGNPYATGRAVALRAALIPITNSLFAVGLVSLPGMMTGQILSGVSPLIAVRYQIMVMFMIFGSAGISAALFLEISRSEFSVAAVKPH